jgi:tol-pal system protein YbgF
MLWYAPEFSLRCWLCPWPRGWAHVGAVLLVAVVPVIARAQDSNTLDRLDRLERDLSMLQRQVYRGGPSMAAPGGGGSTSAADIEIRMERLEAQMRDLTGRVEQTANGMEQLRQRLEQINSDLDVRLGQAGGGAAGLAPGRPGAVGPPPAANSQGKFASDAFPPPPPGAVMPPGTVVPPPTSGGGSTGGLNPIFNTLSPPGTAPPRPPAPEPAGAPPPPTGGGSINEQFNHAFGLVKQADYTNAEVALRAFIDAHPNDPLAGNAQYWLGQTYYARNRYQEAAGAFAEGFKRYPKSAKAPEDLLYLGMSLAKADQKKNACLALGQLEQAFPNASAAVRERANAEKKRLACG